jgi:hypothetical protein
MVFLGRRSRVTIITDADSGQSLTDHELNTYEEVESYIATHFPDCERWRPSPATYGETAELERVFEMLDSGIELSRVKSRRFLIGQLYECGYPDETTARIRAALARLA